MPCSVIEFEDDQGRRGTMIVCFDAYTPTMLEPGQEPLQDGPDGMDTGIPPPPEKPDGEDDTDGDSGRTGTGSNG
jgi:hypothetical protein